jgi:glycosyltransferase involved in cell wall biosynthesis
MPDFSIVIPYRGNPMGLWATIETSELNMRGTDLTREYIIVSNGQKETADTWNYAKLLEKHKLLAHYSHRDEPMSPPSARQLGVKYATGTYLCFFDSHCIPLPDYFKRAKLDFEKWDIDALHSVARYGIMEYPHYHYLLRLKRSFWGSESAVPQHPFLPYRVAMAGHGGFFAKASTFREIGGYWDGFIGYAGEEPYFDLKMALLDKKNWMDPRLEHIHYVGERGYPRHYTENYCLNLLMAANIIGGEKWMYTVQENLSKSTKAGFGNVRLYDIMMEADERSAEHARWMASVRKRTLDEQFNVFVAESIAY